MIARVKIIAVNRFSGPERIFVELDKLSLRSTIFSAAKDHAAETPVAYRKRIDPLRRRLVVPEHKWVYSRLGRRSLRERSTLRKRQIAERGGCSRDKASSSEFAHAERSLPFAD